jgi:hypothetical protein
MLQNNYKTAIEIVSDMVNIVGLDYIDVNTGLFTDGDSSSASYLTLLLHGIEEVRKDLFDRADEQFKEMAKVLKTGVFNENLAKFSLFNLPVYRLMGVYCDKNLNYEVDEVFSIKELLNKQNTYLLQNIEVITSFDKDFIFIEYISNNIFAKVDLENGLTRTQKITDNGDIVLLDCNLIVYKMASNFCYAKGIVAQGDFFNKKYLEVITALMSESSARKNNNSNSLFFRF